jgi:probable phosphomutase (TIGR03848 family)
MSPRKRPGPPTTVLFVRHGLTPTTGREMPSAPPGPELTEVGRQQAKEAGALIAEWAPTLPPLAALYTSPLARTAETAAIVGQAVGLEAVERTALADCDAGDWAGAPLKDLNKQPEWPTVVQYPSAFTFPGGEALSGMQARVVGEVRQLVAAHPGHTVVVVSHADPIKALLADALGMHLDLFQRISVSPASVSAVNYGPTGPVALLVNWTGTTSHRPPAPAPRRARRP